MTFRHDSPGTAESLWCAAEPWHDAPALDLATVTSLVVLAAHPDDETLGAGGLIASAHARGMPVSVVIASDGEASHPRSPTTTPMELGRRRRVEVRHALDVVAPDADLTFLGMPDGELVASDLIPAFVSAIGRAPGDVLVVSTWEADGHPDHVAVARAAREAARTRDGATLVAAPIWAWHWSTPDADDIPWPDVRMMRLCADAVEAKREALARHTSQVAPLSERPGDEALLTREFVEHFLRPFEVFVGVDADERPSGTLTREFFDAFYDDKDDPWEFETRWYERRKRAVTLAALPRERYRAALELGCSVGVLTQELAQRTDALLAIDVAAAPLRVARERLAGEAHIRFEQRAIPDDWPEGVFDLVVVSEVGYYLDTAALELLVERVEESVSDDGCVVVCHWRHLVHEYPHSGDAVHAAFARSRSLTRTVRHVEDDFLLDVLQPGDAASVARETGLLG